MKMQGMDLHHTEKSEEGIGILHYHRLGNVLITVSEPIANWIIVGTLVYFLVYVCGAPKGVVVVQSIRRKPEDQQWNVELLQSIQGAP